MYWSSDAFNKTHTILQRLWEWMNFMYNQSKTLLQEEKYQGVRCGEFHFVLHFKKKLLDL